MPYMLEHQERFRSSISPLGFVFCYVLDLSAIIVAMVIVRVRRSCGPGTGASIDGAHQPALLVTGQAGQTPPFLGVSGGRRQPLLLGRVSLEPHIIQALLHACL